MKNIHNSLVIATVALLSLGVNGSLFAQEKPAEQPFHWQKGDTIMLDHTYIHYLTGERISKWVYNVPHQILQVGTKKYPDGLLLGGIMSWVAPEGVILQGATPRKDGSATSPAAVKETAPAEEQTVAAQEKQSQEQAAGTSVQGQPAGKAPAQVTTAPAETQNVTTEKVQTSQEGQQPTEMVTPSQEQTAGQVSEEGAISSDTTQTVSRPRADGTHSAPKAVVKEERAEPSYTITSQPKKYNYHRFTIGVHGGYANYLPHLGGSVDTKGGFDALLDLQYAYYWTKFGRDFDLGIITGIGFGYSQGGIRNDETFSETGGIAADNSLYDVNYAFSADGLKETDRQLQLEIPVLFSLVRDKGLFFNAGVRFMLPVYTPYTRTITGSDIDWSFPNLSGNTQQAGDYGKLFPAQLADDQSSYSGKWANQWKLNILLDLEIGYEWTLASGNSLGLGAAVNFFPLSLYKGESDGKILNVSLPTANGNAEVVPSTSVTEAYSSRLGYLGLGVKVAYHFNFPKKFGNIKTE